MTAAQAAEELRALRAILTPETRLRELQASTARRESGVLAEMANIQVSLGWLDEAKANADAVLNRTALAIDRPSYARALIAFAYCESKYDLEKALRSFDHAVALARTLGPSGLDSYIAAQINRALVFFERDEIEAVSELERLLTTIARAPYLSTRLKALRLANVEYNLISTRAASGSDDVSVLGLQRLADHCAAIDYPGIAAKCLEALSKACKDLDLYSQSLYYSTLAEETYRRADAASLSLKVTAQRGKIYKSLGDVPRATAVARQLLDATPDTTVGRARRIAGVGLLADLAEYAGDLRAMAKWNLQAGYLTLNDPPGAGVVPTGPLGFITAAYEAARKLRDPELLRQTRDLIRRWSPPPDGHRYQREFMHLQQVVAAGVASDSIRFRHYLDQFISSPIFALERAEMTGLASTFQEVFFPVDLDDDAAYSVDLEELWKHVLHLAGEDDEIIRTRYMRANVEPVLNRILARSSSTLAAHHQFELVELSRVTGFDRTSASLNDHQQSLRGKVRQTAHAHVDRFLNSWTTAVPLRHPIDWNEQLRSCLTDISGLGANRLDLLLQVGNLPNASGILQLYLHSGVLHWVWSDGGGRPLSGRRNVSSFAMQAIDAFRSTMLPTITAHDLSIASRFDLPREQLSVVSALRVALSPMGDSDELARDLAAYLPRDRRARILDETSRSPWISIETLSRAMGELIPAQAWSAPPGRILLSSNQALTHLPIALAISDGGVLLLQDHYLTTMPPLDLLSTLDPQVGDVVSVWHVERIENSGGDLNFAGERADGTAGHLLFESKVAAKSVLIYRGHLVTSEVGRPGLASVILGLDAPSLVTQAELRDANSELRAPRRVALMACRAAGWDIASEWGGLGPALIERGTREFLAPMWTLIDSPECQELDAAAEAVMVSPDPGKQLWELKLGWLESQLKAEARLGAHWWSSLNLLSI